jgi:hypothetical protein
MNNTKLIELDADALQDACGGQMGTPANPGAELDAGYASCDRRFGVKGSWPNRTMHSGCIAGMNLDYGGWYTQNAKGDIQYDFQRHVDGDGHAVMGTQGAR